MRPCGLIGKYLSYGLLEKRKRNKEIVYEMIPCLFVCVELKTFFICILNILRLRNINSIHQTIVDILGNLGGLGLRDLITMNSACIMKLTWALREGGDKLWCQVL